jgi:hypothetical protein
LPCGVLQLDELGDSLIALVLVLSALGHNGGVILARELPACVGSTRRRRRPLCHTATPPVRKLDDVSSFLGFAEQCEQR